MIIGIGNDLIDIRRIEKTLDRHGERFSHRVFTVSERDTADSRPHRAAAYAKRFAAKEACAKALGSGIADGVFLRDMGVENFDNGRPYIKLTGGAAQHLEKLTPAGFEAEIHLTITDDFPLAQAFVIIYGTRKAQ